METEVAVSVSTPVDVKANTKLARTAEQSFMEAESKWFLETQAPPILCEIETIIKTALNCCVGSGDKGLQSSQINSPSTLAVTSASTDIVKGFVTIDGTAIVKGELTLKLPHYNRGNAIKVAINPAKPPKLEQLRSAQNYLAIALQLFSKYPRSVWDRGGLAKLLQHLSTVIRRAQKALSRVKAADGFPLKECDSTAFSPELREDLVVEFFVLRSSLMVAIKALNFPQQGIPLQIQSKLLGKFRNIKLETYKGRPVEVLDEVAVGSASPRLATLLQSLNTVAALCEEMSMKLRVFKSR